MGCDPFPVLIIINNSQISTHTSRVGCDLSQPYGCTLLTISTHTSRVGCDNPNGPLDRYLKISTHTSRVGCDFEQRRYERRGFRFLLTHPVWDVTTSNCIFSSMCLFLLTHPVWDVTGSLFVFTDVANKISTHTSRVGCDKRYG